MKVLIEYTWLNLTYNKVISFFNFVDDKPFKIENTKNKLQIINVTMM